jgi:hypothetical protein
VRQLQQAPERGIVGRRKSQLFDHKQPAILRQDADNGGFSILRRHDGDANVDVRTSGPQPGGAVLRQAPFRDVEAGDDFDAGNQRLRQDAGGRRDRPQQAVDPHPDRQPGVERLDMNVACAQFDRFFQKIVNGAHHRRAAGQIAQALDIVFARLEGFDAAGGLDIVFAQALAENDRQIFECRHLDDDAGAEHDLRRTPRCRVARIRHREHGAAVG